MLLITTAALERLSRKLKRKKVDDDTSLRFRRADGQWQLRPDRERPHDETFAHEGRQVLVLDKISAEAMSAMVLTVKTTDSGPRLRLRKKAASEE